MRRLPSLNALRAFEAAARHSSFTLAADELNVTQGAISRHVKMLEQQLGSPLFRRGHRSLTLTEAGERLLPGLVDGFDRIERAAASVTRSHAELTVKVPPTFAVRWLIRRLPRFEAAHPDIQIRMTTAWHSVDFTREAFDCGVHYGDGRLPGVRSDLILPEILTPVCAPALLRGPKPLARPADLARHTLLHSLASQADWRVWLEAAGLPDPERFRSQSFDIEDVALQAAAAGHGVTIANIAFVREDLAAGRLVAPFADITATLGADYYFVAPLAQARRREVAALRDWLVAEGAESRRPGALPDLPPNEPRLDSRKAATPDPDTLERVQAIDAPGGSV